jgi:hypothetical protein
MGLVMLPLDEQGQWVEADLHTSPSYSNERYPMIQQHLDAMALIEAISAELGTVPYLWGGWTVDIYHGRPTRAHGDIDCFVVDLHQHVPAFSERLLEAAWEVRTVLDGYLLAAKKEGVKLQLGHVEISGAAVDWKHNGNAGSILFPVAWLRPDPIAFLGVTVHVAAPELGYVLKTNPSLMNPDWQPREKDRVDTDRLRDVLLGKHIDLDSLSLRVSRI